jgi:hypothetical protein
MDQTLEPGVSLDCGGHENFPKRGHRRLPTHGHLTNLRDGLIRGQRVINLRL